MDEIFQSAEKQGMISKEYVWIFVLVESKVILAPPNGFGAALSEEGRVISFPGEALIIQAKPRRSRKQFLEQMKSRIKEYLCLMEGGAEMLAEWSRGGCKLCQSVELKDKEVDVASRNSLKLSRQVEHPIWSMVPFQLVH